MHAQEEKKEQEQDPFEVAVKSVTAPKMKVVLTKIASDEFEGRRTGMTGMKKARAYMIGRLRAWNVSGLDDSYEQDWGLGKNILAWIPGTDPELKKKILILCAHYDHLGKAYDSSKKKGDDDIFNGADDNASGSTALLFVARALQLSKIRTRRSILFLWTSGEEQGMNGAKAFCRKPVRPLSQIAALINCDMIGRNPDKDASLYGTSYSPEFDGPIQRALKRIPNARVTPVPGRGLYYHRTDTNIFKSRSIPGVFLFSGMHGDYHRVTDEAERIDYKRLAVLTRFILALTVELGNLEQKITFYK